MTRSQLEQLAEIRDIAERDFGAKRADALIRFAIQRATAPESSGVPPAPGLVAAIQRRVPHVSTRPHDFVPPATGLVAAIRKAIGASVPAQDTPDSGTVPPSPGLVGFIAKGRK